MALAAAGCGQDEQQAPGAASAGREEITVGATLPLRGSEATVGGLFREGYELAFAQADEAGGVPVRGRRTAVRLVLRDDASDEQRAVAEAERLLSGGADLMLGTYSTKLVEPQATVAERHGVPYVNGGGAATSSYERGYRWVFGLLAPVEGMAEETMAWVAEQQRAGRLPRPARIALLWEQTGHGEDYRKGVARFATRSGGAFEVVLDESFALDQPSYEPLLRRVRAAQADVLLADAHLADFITMHREYAEAGMCHPVVSYGARGQEAQAAQALGRRAVEGLVSATWWHPQLATRGAGKRFVEAFRARYGREPQWYQALAYEAARTLLEAVRRAGSAERSAVREALSRLRLRSLLPGGTLSFPAVSGQQARYPFLVQQNTARGTAPIVSPPALANAAGKARSCPGERAG